MNATHSKNNLLYKFKDQLPEILYTNIPIPAFMETPISDLIFKKKKTTYRKSSKAKVPAVSASCLEGSIENGQNTKYAINDKDLEIDNGTWIIGNIACGLNARAKGRMQGDKFYVSQLVILKK